MKKAHDARIKHEDEMRHQAMLKSDEYIISLYEKKYGFDLINDEMGLYEESSSSEGSVLFEEERRKPEKKV